MKRSHSLLIAVFLSAAFLYPVQLFSAPQNGISSDGNELIGVWEDPETHNLITIKQVNGKPSVVSIIDNDDMEKMTIELSSFENGVLSYRYKVPSTGYVVSCSSTSLDKKGLNYKWANQNANGTDVLVRMMSTAVDEKTGTAAPAAVPEAPKSRLIGKIYKIKGSDIIIATADASFVPAAGDKIFVTADGAKIGLDVVFPMMTVSKCRISAQDRAQASKVKINMPVYK